MRKSIGFKRLFAGFVFLLSPDLSIFDFLPDFIGYLLIVSGLSRLADIDERAKDARILSKRLFLLYCVKFVLSLYLGSLEKTNLLLATFSLAILDVVLVIPFVKDLFHSIDYTATRQGVMIPSGKTTETKVLLGAFFVIKDCLMVAPCLVSLFDPSETGNFNDSTWYVDFGALTNVITVLCFFLTALLSVFVTVKVCIYFVKLCRNRELVTSLWSNYDRTVLQVPSRLISKRVVTQASIITAAVVFFVDFYIDYIDVLPTAIGLLLVFCFSLYTHIKMKINTVFLTVVSALATVSSAWSFFYRLHFQRELGAAVEYNFSSKPYTVLLGVLSFVLTLLSLVFVWVTVWNLENRYLGEKNTPRTVAFSIASLVICAFGFVLYVYPQRNVDFVFPNLIFSAVFVGFFVDRIGGFSKEILSKYKNKD